MRIKSIAAHLRPYIMLARRRTTINHAFAAATAPSDSYDEEVVADALRGLGMDPKSDLLCAYCHEDAETWDHIFATVKDSRFSGHGHRLGNLLPCCKPCNSRKGNKPWEIHLSSLPMSDEEREARAKAITQHIDRHGTDEQVFDSPERKRLDDIRLQVLDLLAEGDRLAAKIRAETSGFVPTSNQPAPASQRAGLHPGSPDIPL